MEQIKTAEQLHQTSIKSVESLPDQVNGRKGIPLKFRVICEEGCLQIAGKIFVTDTGESESLIVALPLENAESETVTIPAPSMPGVYTWNITYQPEEGTPHEACTIQYIFSVKPHVITLSAWGALSPANKGEAFAVCVGAFCSGGCHLAGLPYTIHDDGGVLLASGELGQDALPQTEGTYWSEQALLAPDDEAVHTWAVRSAGLSMACPHQMEETDFTFRTAIPPAYTVTVTVMDRIRGMSVPNANVMLGLHRTIADNAGVAVLSVPGGEQEMRISKIDYVSTRQTIEVIGDCDLTVALEYCPPG